MARRKGKVHEISDWGGRVTEVTMNGIGVGPKVTERDATTISDWLNKAFKQLEVYFRRRFLQVHEGWGCDCACHRLRKSTKHCVGCYPGRMKRIEIP